MADNNNIAALVKYDYPEYAPICDIRKPIRCEEQLNAGDSYEIMFTPQRNGTTLPSQSCGIVILEVTLGKYGIFKNCNDKRMIVPLSSLGIVPDCCGKYNSHNYIVRKD